MKWIHVRAFGRYRRSGEGYLILSSLADRDKRAVITFPTETSFGCLSCLALFIRITLAMKPYSICICRADYSLNRNSKERMSVENRAIIGKELVAD
jgi:hypothetical protein